MNCPGSLSRFHSFEGPECFHCNEPNPYHGKFMMDRETAEELSKFIQAQQVKAKFKKVNLLARELYKFIDNQNGDKNDRKSD